MQHFSSEPKRALHSLKNQEKINTFKSLDILLYFSKKLTKNVPPLPPKGKSKNNKPSDIVSKNDDESRNASF